MFRKLSQLLLGSIFLLNLFNCATVRHVSSPERRTYSDPSYEATAHFYIFGFVGKDHHVDLKEICLGKGVDQFTVHYTFGDVLTWLFTAGLYTPATVRVWCTL